jgi:hypothetical protein
MSSTTSSNTLTSGFIDLATYDEPEKYMYGGAKSVSYFVRRVTKSTWFTVVPTTLTLNQTPQFATQWDANISRAGDYMLFNWLRVTFPSVSVNTATARFGANSRIRWTRNLMHHLLKETAVTFNDLVEMRFDDYFLDFWSAFTVTSSKRVGYNNMIGNISLLNNYSNAPGAANNGLVIPQATLLLPLPYCHTRDTGVALPTAALPYNEMKLRFNFRDWTDLLIIDNVAPIVGGAGSGGVSTYASPSDLSNSQVTLSNVQVWAEYALVSNDERKLMGQAPRDLLIEQVQTANPQSVDPTRNTTRIDIHFSHSVKALMFSLQNTSNKAEWANYSSASPVPQPAGVNFAPAAASDALSQVSVYYENTQRLSNMPVDYFSLMQPWYRAPAIPEETGYHLYSYSLDLMDVNPHGSTNYGKLTNVGVEIAPSAEAAAGGAGAGTLAVPDASAANVAAGHGLKQTFSLVLVAVNHNIVRIAGGALGFPVL